VRTSCWKFLFASALLALVIPTPSAQAGAEPREVNWKDLAPKGGNKQNYLRRTSPLVSLILDIRGDKPKPLKMAEALEGVMVRLSGYAVPLKFDGVAVEEFLLVPYIGACVHVPPPPKNQIVLVKSEKPITIRDLFQAVTVTGRMAVKGSNTDITEAGYRLAAIEVVDFSGYRRIKRQRGHPVTVEIP